ncbi:MAG: bifunctional hydroxymethylpyrimidine kinase/phosphomethylpyrimidine kinase [Armatimonadota bacterium]|nr:bifunctional hydroxymethylpyrimidine kinase/phosphomethylpyrimidine kinase [Armatimonadota bacterium]
MKRVLTIAGSDSSAGAGIQADLKVFAQLGVYGMSAVTAVTAQNSRGVQKIYKVAPKIVAAQIDSVVRDIGADACKIGMLYSPQVVDLVAERIERRDIKNVVVDPIVFAKDGTRLLSARAVSRMINDLLPRATLVAPNVAEAELLSGIKVTDPQSAAMAAEQISKFGPDYVLIKGGHLDGEPIDVLFDGQSAREYRGERVAGPPMRGTGCALTAAIAALLAQGHSVQDAVAFAKQFVASAIAHAVKLGKGKVSFYTGTQGEG